MDDEKKNSCEVCFHDFDHLERRPRVVPCGHTFCSKCVSDNFKENLLLCPICRRQHHAETATDFPVNFTLESFLVGGKAIPSTPAEICNPSTNEPKALSKKLKSIREELCSGMENKATNNKEVRSQLHEYENLLSEKEMVHHKIKEIYLAIAQRNDDIIQIIRKERVRISEALKEEEEETQKMKIVSDKLHAATTPQEVFLSMEDATICYDFLETWNQEAQENFPNIQLLTKSVVLVEQSQILLQTFPDNKGEAAAEEPTEITLTDLLSENMASISLHGMEASSETPNENVSSQESSLLNPKLSIQEKVTGAMENASYSRQTKTPVRDVDEKSVLTESNATVTELITEGIQTDDPTPVRDVDEKSVQTESREAVTELISREIKKETVPTMLIESLRMRYGSVIELMNEKRLFAVEEFEGRRKFAQITLEENHHILLHYLKDQNIPSNAHLLQHKDVMKLVNVSSRLVFMELRSKEKNETLGKLFIRLSPDGKRAQQFALLCSGQNGPSYVDTNLNNTFDKGFYVQYVICGDYENLGGNGGRALLPDVLKEKGGVFKRPAKAGTIYGHSSEATAAQFFICTSDFPRRELDGCFGMVEEGFPILQNAIDNYININNFIISDAGLVLDV